MRYKERKAMGKNYKAYSTVPCRWSKLWNKINTQ